MEQNYSKGGYGYGHAKKELLEYILSHFSKERDRFNYYMSNKDELDKVLNEGAQKANSVASKVLNRVRNKLGYN
jgi:tryptophanyl-tRNA synthetase